MSSFLVGCLFIIHPASAACAQDGDFIWAKGMGGTGIDFGMDISVDSSGNVYTVGYFQDTVDFDPGPATFNQTSSGSDDIFISKLDRQGNFVWTKIIGGAMEERGYSISLDLGGNVYIIGYFYGVLDFDPGPATFNLTSAGETDVFICKLDSDGNFIWAKGFGGTIYDIGLDIFSDSAGNVYSVGRFQDTADFDPGLSTYNLISQGGYDIYVNKLDSGGDFVWAKAMGGSATDIGNGVTVDNIGNVYTTGYFQNTVDFNPGFDEFNLVSMGEFDIFVSKLNSGGDFVWARAMGGSSTEVGNAIAIDKSGNVYTTGYFYFTVDFDPDQSSVFNLYSPGMDIFISKLDSSGNFVWAGSVGGNSPDVGNGIYVDNKGSIYTTGYFTGTADFDPGPGTVELTSAGTYDVFVCKLDSGNNLIWAKAMGGSATDIGKGITVDNNGNVYTIGHFNGTADFDPGTEMFDLTGSGSDDIFISKLAGHPFPWPMFLPATTNNAQP